MSKLQRIPSVVLFPLQIWWETWIYIEEICHEHLDTETATIYTWLLRLAWIAVTAFFAFLIIEPIAKAVM